MSAKDTAKAIAEKFSLLGAGVVDKGLERTIWQQLALDFSQLALDMAPSVGWTDPTGVATKGGFDTGTVTISTLAENVKALIDAGLANGDLVP